MGAIRPHHVIAYKKVKPVFMHDRQGIDIGLEVENAVVFTSGLLGRNITGELSGKGIIKPGKTYNLKITVEVEEVTSDATD